MAGDLSAQRSGLRARQTKGSPQARIVSFESRVDMAGNLILGNYSSPATIFLLLHFAMAEHCGLGLRVARDPATRLVIIDGLASGGPADRSGGMTAPPSRARCHSL